MRLDAVPNEILFLLVRSPDKKIGQMYIKEISSSRVLPTLTTSQDIKLEFIVCFYSFYKCIFSTHGWLEGTQLHIGEDCFNAQLND